MGNPEWADEEIFKDRLVRAVNWDVLKVLLQEWVGQQTVLDLYRKRKRSEFRLPRSRRWATCSTRSI